MAMDVEKDKETTRRIGIAEQGMQKSDKTERRRQGGKVLNLEEMKKRKVENKDSEKQEGKRRRRK